MHPKGEKKLTVTSKQGPPKKPNLEIKLPQDTEPPQGIRSGPAGFQSFAKEDPVTPSKYQTVSTVTSPTYMKSVQPMPEIP